MIKTVSFAPPRSSRAASGAKATKTKSAPTARGASGSSPSKAAKVPASMSVEQARAALQPSPAASSKATRAPKSSAAPKSAAAKAGVAPKAGDKKAAVAPQIAAAKVEVAPKAKRSRAPKDLALQYGGVAEEAPRAAAPAEAPRKRITKAERAARAQLVRPDDDLLQRLERAQTVAPARAPKRARGWEFVCGRCGRVAHFSTPGALCECGAIALRESN